MTGAAQRAATLAQLQATLRALGSAVDGEAWGLAGTLTEDAQAVVVGMHRDALAEAAERADLVADVRSTRVWQESGYMPGESTWIPGPGMPAYRGPLARLGDRLWRSLTKGGQL